MFVLFEHHDAGAFAHHEPVAVRIIGARGLGGLVVPIGGQRLAGRETSQCDAADRGLGAAGNHDVRIVQGDQPGGVADGMRARRAGGDDRVVRTCLLYTSPSPRD